MRAERDLRTAALSREIGGLPVFPLQFEVLRSQPYDLLATWQHPIVQLHRNNVYTLNPGAAAGKHLPLRPLDIYFQQIDVADAEIPEQFVESDPGNARALRGGQSLLSLV